MQPNVVLRWSGTMSIGVRSVVGRRASERLGEESRKTDCSRAGFWLEPSPNLVDVGDTWTERQIRCRRSGDQFDQRVRAYRANIPVCCR